MLLTHRLDKWRSVSFAPLSSGLSFGKKRHLGAQPSSERTLLARTRWGRLESAPRTACAAEKERRRKCQGRWDMRARRAAACLARSRFAVASKRNQRAMKRFVIDE